jgi:ABC-type microcin C transport system permease subunit YejB
MYGFDKPIYERFWIMMKSYAVFDFGESFFRNRRVVDLVIDKMPVSISLGLWTTLLVYSICIPLGIRKAIRDGSRLRRHELDGADRAERNPGVPVRHPAGRAAGRRHLRQMVPAARPGVRRLVGLSIGHKILDYVWHMVCRSAQW